MSFMKINDTKKQLILYVIFIVIDVSFVNFMHIRYKICLNTTFSLFSFNSTVSSFLNFLKNQD